MENTTPLALYVHWPFCKAKCPYCDFNSHVREGVNQAAWREALLRELAHMAALSPDHQLTSIFFGGGTPSLMPPETVGAIIDAATTHWQTDPHIEITLEANPTSTEAANLHGFKAAGINRVSMGIQSLRQDALTFLGREHNAPEALAALHIAQKLFDRVSFDLIYARPEQTLSEWETELREALTHTVGHLSLYQLTIEPNTAFHHSYYQKGAFAMPEENLAADFYSLTNAMMEEAGLPAYEISNHARPGEESRHNLSYWRAQSYIGIGPGAHGRPLVEGKRLASATLKSPERWLENVQQTGHGIEQWEAMDSADIIAEKLMMGLRLHEGVALPETAHINKEKLSFYEQKGLLIQKDGRLAASKDGKLVLNSLIAELLV